MEGRGRLCGKNTLPVSFRMPAPRLQLLNSCAHSCEIKHKTCHKTAGHRTDGRPSYRRQVIVQTAGHRTDGRSSYRWQAIVQTAGHRTDGRPSYRQQVIVQTAGHRTDSRPSYRQQAIVPSLKSSTARNSLMPASVSAGWDSLSESSCDWKETAGKGRKKMLV